MLTQSGHSSFILDLSWILCPAVGDLPKKGTQGGFIDLSLIKYFLKWSWLSSTASSRILLFLSGIACRWRREEEEDKKKKECHKLCSDHQFSK